MFSLLPFGDAAVECEHVMLLCCIFAVSVWLETWHLPLCNMAARGSQVGASIGSPWIQGIGDLETLSCGQVNSST